MAVEESLSVGWFRGKHVISSVEQLLFAKSSVRNISATAFRSPRRYMSASAVGIGSRHRQILPTADNRGKLSLLDLCYAGIIANLG